MKKNLQHIALEKKTGKKVRKYEDEANPDMHAAKNSMRRKGFDSGKIFHLALKQGEKYTKAHLTA